MWSSIFAAGSALKGLANGTVCFAAGTLVLTKQGNKPIEDIQVGDEVWSYNEETGIGGFKHVKQLFRNTTTKWITVTIDGKEITSTPGHKYYLPENTYYRNPNEQHEHAGYENLSVKWVSAQNLKSGDKVLLFNGKYGIVERVETKYLNTPETTYNFEVEDYHTYFVGEHTLLVLV